MTATGARILIVDDEESIRGLLRRALEECGYDVVAVNDGLAGFEAVRTSAQPYGLGGHQQPHAAKERGGAGFPTA
jgi:CheY-like chemotaxis protein